MMDLIAGFLISPLSYKYEPMWTKTSPGVEWRVVANFKKKTQIFINFSDICMHVFFFPLYKVY